ncbi:GGDEF domain-containing protein [Propionivibrio dicarboxylicus]|uniref:Diguanylate cyclase (GGDEF) domain-containing protein n=1 Tax=Propionivibrio dicarboxylicus TaxID=83767 RepID=A0A1G8FWH4_9RHOO|nr:GGDEF domain-containing protein [Propionivibrio dicarboxylicus]SDH86492.1 diguanylate cyclase (GGDEF) domain-containing protein [Propionivibrio dicarboxylicus]
MDNIDFDQHSAKGEVAGSFLLGLVESFHHLQILPDGGMQLQAVDIDPTLWYPHSMLIDTLKNIEKTVPAFENIFFRAGVNFLRIWHENGPGKTMVHSSRDWLYANKESGGYNSVVRGGIPDEIGWCLLQSIDEEAGIAIYENVMPLAPEFIRGVFYGGCILFDDLEYIDVEATNEPYEPNPAFRRCIVTIRFRYKPAGIARNLDEKLAALRFGSSVALTAPEVESLIWRYKGLQVKVDLDAAYYSGINAILANTIRTTQAQRDEIELLSNHDALTGLPNRRLALDRLKMACSRAIREKGRFAVLFLDADGFKGINDTYGHEAGDLVLRAIAARLSSCVRAVDTVARQGGDEFLVILSDVAGPSAAGHVAEKILSATARPVYYGDQLLSVSVSIGVAVFPDHGKSTEELLKNADIAMYSIKRTGKNNFAVFLP